jgi:hypothetical protein
MFEDAQPIEAGALRTIRRLLLLILTIGMLGTAVDLFLLDHFDGPWQLPPLVLIGIALVAVAVVATARESWIAVMILRVTMVLFVAAGALGIMLHYNGNLEFQKEMDPTIEGWALFVRIVTAKAPPALAPAAMVQLGMIGLLYTYRHPALTRSR